MARKNVWRDPSCSRCGATLNDDNWTPGLRRELKYRCNVCESKRVKIGRNNNLERYKAAAAERARNKEKKPGRLAVYSTVGRPRGDSAKLEQAEDWRRRRYLWQTYKITKEEYDLRIKAQNHRCVICRSVEDQLVVDHCHHTGRIRGLLCSQCNLSLGPLEAWIKTGTFIRALEYLRDDYRAKLASLFP